ncbi:hypothetical protein SAMN02745728_00877 [Desulfovibrio litoralis DSM 11393]|uniref:Uncharacterized protein n=2 Tax=Desulfovibrio litoralis TaxID=466107 RepID=A0A1M7SFC7_9BACT|nr:hypothetical protein SAMN02745728_00877 [Desulfovibrio litoralis DSM 11393]
MIAIVFGTTLVLNSCRLIVDRGYFIPNDSSIFTFKPTVENNGSGEWWIYGEDYTYYYAYPEVDDYMNYDYAGVELNIYIKIRKINNCPNFNKEDYKTWCDAIKTSPQAK